MGNAISPSSNDDRIWGGAGADTIHGDEGNDHIWSGDRSGTSYDGLDDAGLEHDQLFGGDGDDVLAIGYGDDADGGSGSDRLRISFAGAPHRIVLDTGEFTPGGVWQVFGSTIQNVETLDYLLGSVFDDNFTAGPHLESLRVPTNAENHDLAGNELANELIGNDGANVLAGHGGNDVLWGGDGADRLEGGSGDDVYYIDAADEIVELAGEGYDTVFTAISYVLPAHVERLVVTDLWSLTSLSLTGNALANEITGNAGANLLDGGADADLMFGGEGNDAYIVDDIGDQIVEAVDVGYDTVFATVSYTHPDREERLVP